MGIWKVKDQGRVTTENEMEPYPNPFLHCTLVRLGKYGGHPAKDAAGEPNQPSLEMVRTGLTALKVLFPLLLEAAIPGSMSQHVRHCSR